MKTDKPKGEAALTWSLGNNTLVQPYSLWPSEHLVICKVEQRETYPPWPGKLLTHGETQRVARNKAS